MEILGPYTWREQEHLRGPLMPKSFFLSPHTDESTLATGHPPVREAGHRCTSPRGPGGPGHHSPAGVQLFLGTRGSGGDARPAVFPHDLHGPDHLGVFCVDSAVDHVSPGQSDSVPGIRRSPSKCSFSRCCVISVLCVKQLE